MSQDGIYLYNKYGKPISWDTWVSVRKMLGTKHHRDVFTSRSPANASADYVLNLVNGEYLSRAHKCVCSGRARRANP